MMRRREFITLLGGAAVAWPVVARAQQPAMPVIGFLSSLSATDASRITAAFYQGLNETGYIDGRNVAVEFRWADGQYDRLPAMADELVQRKVAVIAAISGTPAGLAAKSATTSIPIVFAIGGDPVAPGPVTNLSRPAGNVTGVTFFTSPLAAKRLGLLHDLVPKATTFAVLTNPDNPPSLLEGIEVPAAAKAFGQEASVFNATTEADIDDAFAAIARQGIGALFVSADPLFFNYRNKVVALAGRHRTPATYAYREQIEAGGLIITALADRVLIVRRASMWGAFSMVRIPARYRLCCRPSSNWCSISRPPRRSALRCLRISSNSPTR